MKKIFTLAAAVAAVLGMNAQTTYTLDLTKSTTALEFDATNGMWTQTYNEDIESIDSQVFQFVHSAMTDWDTWWGFTASNSADNKRQENTILYQFSNMAMGGIELAEDGTVKKDEYGNPVVSAAVPYLVGYYNAYMARRPNDMTFAGGKAYDAVGVYVNLNSYPYYTIEYGDSFARAFNRTGDKFALTIHGVAPDNTEKTVEVELASCDNGNLTINRGWRYVDLTELGTVNELYFTMTTTDKGTYGDNTPGYFCLDKLIVKDTESGSAASLVADQTGISYDRASHTVTLSGADFAVVYDAVGNAVIKAEGQTIDVSSLAAGVYIVRSGNASLKIAK